MAEERCVLVMGGGRGIGRAIVEAFAALGDRVVVCDTNTLSSSVNQYRSTKVLGFDAAQELERELRAAGRQVVAMEADANSPEDVERLFGRVRSEFGRLDVVVNAFGITHVSRVESMTAEAFSAILNGNLMGVFLVSKAAIPLMRERGGGAIINISSVSGRKGFAKVAHYCAAKFGLIGFSQSLALEVAEAGIRVNVVCPGIVRTGMWEYLLSEFTRPGETREQCWQRMVAMVPQKAAQSPRQVAESVVFLAGATSITGQVLGVDGGMA